MEAADGGEIRAGGLGSERGEALWSRWLANGRFLSVEAEKRPLKEEPEPARSAFPDAVRCSRPRVDKSMVVWKESGGCAAAFPGASPQSGPPFSCSHSARLGNVSPGGGNAASVHRTERREIKKNRDPLRPSGKTP